MKQIFTGFWVLVFCCFLSHNILGQQVESMSAWMPTRIGAIKIDNQGDKIIAGFARGTQIRINDSTTIDLEGSSRDTKFFVAKLDKYDQLIWARNGLWLSEEVASASNADQVSVEIDNANNIVILYSAGGDVNPPVNFPSFTNTVKWKDNTYNTIDNFLLKLTPEGEEIWHKPFYFNKASKANAYMVMDSKGDIFVCETVLGRTNFIPDGGGLKVFWINMRDGRRFTIQNPAISDKNVGICYNKI